MNAPWFPHLSVGVNHSGWPNWDFVTLLSQRMTNTVRCPRQSASVGNVCSLRKVRPYARTKQRTSLTLVSNDGHNWSPVEGSRQKGTPIRPYQTAYLTNTGLERWAQSPVEGSRQKGTSTPNNVGYLKNVKTERTASNQGFLPLDSFGA